MSATSDVVIYLVSRPGEMAGEKKNPVGTCEIDRRCFFKVRCGGKGGCRGGAPITLLPLKNHLRFRRSGLGRGNYKGGVLIKVLLVRPSKMTQKYTPKCPLWQISSKLFLRFFDGCRPHENYQKIRFGWLWGGSKPLAAVVYSLPQRGVLVVHPLVDRPEGRFTREAFNGGL